MVRRRTLARFAADNKAGTMKNIPFGAFPKADRIAVAEAVRRSGMGARQVCVSQLQLPELADAGVAPSVTLVSAGGWWGSYTAAGTAWLQQLESDLGRLRPRS